MAVMRTVPSAVAVASSRPSGLKATSVTAPWWPRSSSGSPRPSSEITRTEPSKEASARRCWSGLQAGRPEPLRPGAQRRQLAQVGGAEEPQGAVHLGHRQQVAAWREAGPEDGPVGAQHARRAAVERPEPDRGVELRGRDHLPAVGREGHVGDAGLVPLQPDHLAAPVGVVDADDAVEPGGGHARAVGAPGREEDGGAGRRQRQEQRAVAGAPDPGHAVLGAGEDALLGGVPRGGVDDAGRVGHHEELAAAGAVPGAGGAVVAGGEQPAAVAAPGHGVDQLEVAGQQAAGPGLAERPDPHRALPGAGHHAAAVGGEGGRHDRRPLERGGDRLASAGPEEGLAVGAEGEEPAPGRRPGQVEGLAVGPEPLRLGAGIDAVDPEGAVHPGRGQAAAARVEGQRGDRGAGGPQHAERLERGAEEPDHAVLSRHRQAGPVGRDRQGVGGLAGGAPPQHGTALRSRGGGARRRRRPPPAGRRAA